MQSSLAAEYFWHLWLSSKC